MSHSRDLHDPLVLLQRVHRWRTAFIGLTILLAGIAIGASGKFMWDREQARQRARWQATRPNSPARWQAPDGKPAWVSLTHRLDRHLTLTDAQKRGLKLFTGKANCIECHNGPLLSDQRYYNLGVPPAVRWEEDGLAQITFRYEQYAKGVTEAMYRTIKDDAGLYYRTKQKSDKGKFRVPSLRYTLYTAPYMHNGAFFELSEVVDFYDEGGGENEFAATKTKLLKPLNLSDEEKEDLLAFLESLSGAEIRMKTPKLPEYAPLPKVAEAK